MCACVVVPQEEDLVMEVKAGPVDLEITRMSHSVHQAHTLTPHQNKIISPAKSFSVRDFCSPGSFWSGVFFTAGVIFRYFPLLLALMHSLLSSDQHNPKQSKNSITPSFLPAIIYLTKQQLHDHFEEVHGSMWWLWLGENVSMGQRTHPNHTGHAFKFVLCVCGFLWVYFSLLFFFLIFKWKRITKY